MRAHKFLVVLFCFIAATIGFLVKLPSAFHDHDKLLHAAFYFCAAAFFHFLFRKGLIIILIILALFGVLIEYLQELSNKLLHRHIHGRFDIDDVYANCKGLIAYALLALLFFAARAVTRSFTRDQQTDSSP